MLDPLKGVNRESPAPFGTGLSHVNRDLALEPEVDVQAVAKHRRHATVKDSLNRVVRANQGEVYLFLGSSSPKTSKRVWIST